MYYWPVCPRLWPVRLFNYCLPCLYLPDNDMATLRQQLSFLISPAQSDLIEFIKEVHQKVRHDPRILHALVMFQLEGQPHDYKLTLRFHAMFDHCHAYDQTLELFVFNANSRIQSYQLHIQNLDELIDCYIQSYTKKTRKISIVD